METTCASFATLYRFALDGEEPDPNRDFENHLEGCPRCRETLEGLARLTHLSTLWDSPPASASARPGIPGLLIEELIGQGGMGIVFRARQVRLGRDVALKLLPNIHVADPRRRERFAREARAAATVEHPNIVHVYDAGEADGQPYLVMEYVRGGSLADRLDGKALEWQRAAALVATIAEAVAHLHRKGIIHRDLKPSNILLDLDAGESPECWVPKVADFGIARPIDDLERTDTLAQAGTPAYMAPEQVSGRAGIVGPAADVHALGAILFQLLTGRPPFLAASMAETLTLVRDQEPVPPRRLRPGLPRDLETICLQCLQKEPGRRYATAGAVADDLLRVLDGRPICARRSPPVVRAWRWCRRHPAIAGLSTALVLSLTLGFATVLTFWIMAESAHREASAHFQTATALLADLGRVGDLSEPRRDEDRRRLEKALAQCRSLLRLRPEDRNLRLTVARIASRLGELEARRSSNAQALALLQEASGLWESLLANDPCDLAALEGSAQTFHELGKVLQNAGQVKEATESFHIACRRLEPLVHSGRHPTSRLALAKIRQSLAVILTKQGQFEPARQLWALNRASLEASLQQQPDAEACRLLARCCESLGDTDAKLAAVRWAYALDPTDVRNRNSLGIALQSHAEMLPLGKPRRDLIHESILLLESVILPWERRFADAPQDYEIAAAAYAANVGLGISYQGLAQPEDSERYFQRSLDLGQDLILHHPGFDPPAPPLLRVMARFGEMRLSRTEKPASLDEVVQEMCKLATQLGRETGQAADWQLQLTIGLLDLAQHRRFAGELDQADFVIQRTRAILEPLGPELSDRAPYHAAVCALWTQIAKQRCRRTDREATREARLRALDAAQTASDLAPEREEYRELLDDGFVRLARFDAECGRFTDAESSLLRRGQLWPQNSDRFLAFRREFRRLADAILASRCPMTEEVKRCYERSLERAEIQDTLASSSDP